MNAIETLALTLIGEDVASPDVFVEGSTDYAQIRDSVNHAVEELALTTGFHSKTYHLALRADRMFYRMRWTGDTFLYVLECFDRTNHRRLDQISVQELQELDPFWMKLQGYPTHYFQIGYDTVGIYRRPSSSGQVLELRCAVVPKRIENDDDVPKIREAFETAAAYYVCSEYYASRGDANRATEYMQKAYETAGIFRFTTEYQNQQREVIHGRSVYR